MSRLFNYFLILSVVICHLIIVYKISKQDIKIKQCKLAYSIVNLLLDNDNIKSLSSIQLKGIDVIILDNKRQKINGKIDMTVELDLINNIKTSGIHKIENELYYIQIDNHKTTELILIVYCKL